MSDLLTIGDAVATHARVQPHKLAVRDSQRALTFAAWHERANRLANALADLGPGVTVKFTTYTDAGHLTAHVVVAADAEVGSRSVVVTLADGRTATCAGCFTVTAGPKVTEVSPNEIGPGAQRTATVTGANFAPGVKVTVPGSGVAVTSVTVVNSTTLSVGLSTAAVAAPGPRDLIVTNPADAGRLKSSAVFCTASARANTTLERPACTRPSASTESSSSSDSSCESVSVR